MQGELWTKTLELEGKLFKLGREHDKEMNPMARIAILGQMNKARTQLVQYQLCIEEFNKQEELKKIKRKMLR
jgi:hypothetical protein